MVYAAASAPFKTNRDHQMKYEFYAHSTASLFGEGDANTAARLTNLMNQGRAINVWDIRPVDKVNGPLLNIAAEIARHHAAKGERNEHAFTERLLSPHHFNRGSRGGVASSITRLPSRR
jgi:hypothetical protein